MHNLLRGFLSFNLVVVFVTFGLIRCVSNDGLVHRIFPYYIVNVLFYFEKYLHLEEQEHTIGLEIMRFTIMYYLFRKRSTSVSHFSNPPCEI